jgi:hypothetical protein
MSHITDGKCRVRDLDDLEVAGRACGLELVRGKTTHRWYGRFVGDSAPPAGMKPADYGKCLHALRLPQAGPDDYEIGVVKALDGGDGFDLVFDSWGQARLLNAVGGAGLNKLRQEYAVAVALRKAKASLRGFVPKRENLPNGRVRLLMVKR